MISHFFNLHYKLVENYKEEFFIVTTAGNGDRIKEEARDNIVLSGRIHLLSSQEVSELQKILHNESIYGSSRHVF